MILIHVKSEPNTPKYFPFPSMILRFIWSREIQVQYLGANRISPSSHSQNYTFCFGGAAIRRRRPVSQDVSRSSNIPLLVSSSKRNPQIETKRPHRLPFELFPRFSHPVTDPIPCSPNPTDPRLHQSQSRYTSRRRQWVREVNAECRKQSKHSLGFRNGRRGSRKRNADWRNTQKYRV